MAIGTDLPFRAAAAGSQIQIKLFSPVFFETGFFYDLKLAVPHFIGDRESCGARIIGLRNRAADHEMRSPCLQGIGWRGDPFLVARISAFRTYARRHH